MTMRYIERFNHAPYLLGKCNVCGKHVPFFCQDLSLPRESLICGECGSTSRYRSIAKGILRAVDELTGVRAKCLADLTKNRSDKMLRVYDTQIPIYTTHVSYPIPDVLAGCSWIDVQESVYRPAEPWGKPIAPRITNQNLEELTFSDDYFDIVITSDIMEHVRLDNKAHREIQRILRTGGVYIFTVPHFRHNRETVKRILIVDPRDASRDEFVYKPEYHRDPNATDDKSLVYRVYGTDLDEELEALGFSVDYSREDSLENTIICTELFYCRLVRK